MNIGIFADSHYCNMDIACTTRRPKLSYKKLKFALQKFKNNKVDLIVCLGDLIDSDINSKNTENLKKISTLITESGIKCICCMGNHDGFLFDKTSFEDISGLKTAPLYFIREESLFIFLDANFHSDGTKYSEIKTDWTDSNIPESQVEWLKEILKSNSAKQVLVFIHQNLDMSVEKNYLVKNAPVIRQIFEQDGRKFVVFQGHYHPGKHSVCNNIEYITLKAMCEGTENSYLLYII